MSSLQAARDLLAREGIRVAVVASTGAEARRQCRDLRPDAMLVDIDLGRESGFDIARQLASGQEGKSPRVILIAESPALSFLPKPGLSGTAIRAILAAPGEPG
jgi:DNA-binding response OmpR family regulator